MAMKKVSDEELEQIQKAALNASENSVNQSIQEDMKMIQAVQSLAGRSNETYSNANYWEIPLNELPSRGRLYASDIKLMGRPLKVIEIKKISSMNEKNSDMIVNDILTRTIKGIEVENLYLADKLYIILWLRANTYKDSRYKVKFVCEKCGKESEYHFDCDKLETEYLDENFDLNTIIELHNAEKITYNYLTVKDEQEIERFKEINYKLFGEIDDELISIAKMIKTINGKSDSLINKYRWILDIDPTNYIILKEKMEEYGMGIKPYVNVTCEKCQGNSIVPLTFDSSFFFPTYIP